MSAASMVPVPQLLQDGINQERGRQLLFKSAENLAVVVDDAAAGRSLLSCRSIISSADRISENVGDTSTG